MVQWNCSSVVGRTGPALDIRLYATQLANELREAILDLWPRPVQIHWHDADSDLAIR